MMFSGEDMQADSVPVLQRGTVDSQIQKETETQSCDESSWLDLLKTGRCDTPSEAGK